MLYAADFRRAAREALSGRWALAIGTGFLASLLGASINGGGGGGGTSGASNTATNQMAGNGGDFFSSPMAMTMFSIFLIAALVILIWGLATFIIGGAMTLGYAKFNLNLIDDNDPELSDIFSQFGRFGAGFCMQLFRRIFIFLWSLLLIIPGIIASYSYAMAPFILYENPDMGASEAIKESKELMRGNKWRYFCLEFSFLGWGILSVCTLGIGFLWLNPYTNAAKAAFYREITDAKYSDPVFDGRSYDV